jgi:glycosyltransferase involved in cell wall biosynthesis
MRRVLLIAYYYPPVEAIGAVRPAALAKYLPQFGWEAVVLTPQMHGANRPSERVIETGYRDVLTDWKARLGLDRSRSLHDQFSLPLAKKPGSVLPHTRALTFVKYLLTYPDQSRGWIPFALAAVEKLARRDSGIDAVVSTSPPITCHLIGRRAKSMLGCPWVADFRDLWSQNLGDTNGNLRFLQMGLERRTLRQADALVTVSDPWASRLRERYPSKKICTISNGFDPDDFSSPYPPLASDFSITYTGQLYEGQRDPTILFEVLRDLIQQEAFRPGDLRVHFYGRLEPWLAALIKKFALDHVVEVHGHTPRKEVLEQQRKSQILLILPWSDPRETGHHSAKLFEYFAAGRPVLAAGGSRGVLTQALEETRAGVHAFTKAQLREFLLNAYAEYKSCGRVSYLGDPHAIEQYGHPEMARRFAQVLDSVADGANVRGKNAQAVSPLG